MAAFCSGAQTAIEFVEPAPSGETGDGIRRVAREQTVCIVESSGDDAQERHGHFFRLIQHLKKVFCRNRKAPRTFQCKNTCGMAAVAQHTKLAEYLSLPQLAQ